jgi:hypothetical protein
MRHDKRERSARQACETNESHFSHTRDNGQGEGWSYPAVLKACVETASDKPTIAVTVLQLPAILRIWPLKSFEKIIFFFSFQKCLRFPTLDAGWLQASYAYMFCFYMSSFSNVLWFASMDLFSISSRSLIARSKSVLLISHACCMETHHFVMWDFFSFLCTSCRK